jgi:hypothetical protein
VRFVFRYQLLISFQFNSLNMLCATTVGWVLRGVNFECDELKIQYEFIFLFFYSSPKLC